MQTALALALVLLAGGGTEGDAGDRTAWSARLYAHLLDHGDVTGDGKVTVAVVSAHDETDFIPQYFRWLGAHDAYNVKVDSRAAASSAATLSGVDRADAVFLKGGNQGTYYKLWNDTPLEGALKRLVERHGAIGGTSAGAMSLAEVALAGGKSLVSQDVLEDACTAMLDDEDGGSGLHTDFLGFVPDATVDTHFTERARLGRMLGVMARAASENRRAHLMGIGIAEQTGVVLEHGVARVIGADSVWFVQGSPDAALVRKAGQPLGYGPLVAHVLSDGDSYDLATRTPRRATAKAVGTKAGEVPGGALSLDGGDRASERAFAWSLKREPPFGLAAGEGRVPEAIGVADAQGDGRAFAQKRLARELALHPGTAGFLMTRGSTLVRTAAEPARYGFTGTASIVLKSRADGAMTVGAYGSGVRFDAAH